MIAAYIAVPEGWNAFSFQTDLGIGLSSRFYGIENVSVNGADLNIFSTAPITFAQAALGGDVKIQTVDGAVIYNVKPGTKTDTKVRLKGKGVPSLRNSAVRGDHYVTLVIQTPEKLSAEAKEALRRFDELSGNSLHQNDSNPEKSEKKTKRKGFMDKVKEAFVFLKTHILPEDCELISFYNKRYFCILWNRNFQYAANNGDYRWNE